MLSPVEQIKERLSIVEVVSSYVKLQKAGKNYKGLSPFSNEKTPSFFVSPERDMYYCFSTNQGGDIFTFVQKMEGVDFPGALKILADRAGIVLAAENKELRDKRSKVYAALEEATRFFEENLSKRKDAVAYLASRGVMPESVARFRIGYALPEWRSLYNRLARAGITEAEMFEAGLIKKPDRTADAARKEARPYDRFRGRIMFPIADSAGRVVAFSGRIFPEEDNAAKYLNSPETLLYNKSNILYAYNLAKGGIKKFNFSILVEGQMDTVMSYQAGYPNTVGVSGTALTHDQLTLLSRLSKNVVMAFDADRAGVASAGRGAELALAMGMDVKVARLPQGEDPADLIKKDREAWRRAIRESVHIIEFYLAELAASSRDERQYKLKVEEMVVPFVARIKNPLDRAHFTQLIARRLNVNDEAVAEAVRGVPSAAPEHARSMLPEGAPQAAPAPSRDAVAEHLAAIIAWQKTLPKPSLDAAAAAARFESLVGKEKADEYLTMPEDRENEQIFKAELLYEDDVSLAADVEVMLRNLEHRSVKRDFEDVMRALRRAEADGDSDEARRLLARSKKLAEDLAKYVG